MLYDGPNSCVGRFAGFEAECEDLRIEPGDQRDWMGEIGYCQATCLRHLGDNRGAESLLNALQSLAEKSEWRSLGGLWLK